MDSTLSYESLVSQIHSEIVAELPEFREFLRVKAANLASSLHPPSTQPSTGNTIPHSTPDPRVFNHMTEAPPSIRVPIHNANQYHMMMPAMANYRATKQPLYPESSANVGAPRVNSARNSTALISSPTGISTPSSFDHMHEVSQNTAAFVQSSQVSVPAFGTFGSPLGDASTAQISGGCVTSSVAQHKGIHPPSSMSPTQATKPVRRDYNT